MSTPDDSLNSPESEELDLAAHPHDAYFKRVFRNPVMAAALLRSNLPEPVADAIDLEGLTLLPGSFVKHALQQSHADLLFRAPLKGAQADDRADAMLIYLLLEHQTSVDPLMPLRLLGYMTEIWQQAAERQGLPLPPILPFVLHQGPHRWTVDCQFARMFDLPAGPDRKLAPFLPEFRYVVLDLSSTDPAREESDDVLRTVLHLMKLVRMNQALEFFRWLIAMKTALPEALARLSLLYALHSDEHLDAEALGRILLPEPELNRTAMTLAQKLRMEGMQQGMQQGMQRGREQWQLVGKVQLLEQMLGREPTSDLEQLSVAELNALFGELQAAYDLKFKAR